MQKLRGKALASLPFKPGLLSLTLGGR